MMSSSKYETNAMSEVSLARDAPPRWAFQLAKVNENCVLERGDWQHNGLYCNLYDVAANIAL
ncbi:hypothetical protein NUU61_003282 [Penicillium alfredii]|uniref:Uncharacterized protein n=1 Tax=Penicillium alfredii TaxID=1506179 RepID=A0A9W9FTR8_9EURO|nr:uncharacterized protein NUU61_003282 [Penicillium alfredii]KAJ5105935.1 hypothetical protein NUU61_003282 [Penicillium alfredii]